MLYDYIVENFEMDEPIFISDLPGNSKGYIRQELKRLVDDGKMERVYNGVYLLAYTTLLGTRGRMSIDKYVEKKFLAANGKASGYITGIQLANLYGFTSQVPSCIEVCTNEATTKQRKLDIDGWKLIVYQPVTRITEKNRAALQFLDFMTSVEKYSELTGGALSRKVKEFAASIKVDFDMVRKYIELFPDKVYKNIYQCGMMGELVK